MIIESIVNHRQIEIGDLYKNKYGGLALVVDIKDWNIYYECYNNPDDKHGSVLSLRSDSFIDFYKKVS
jgi:hypothetical protein